MSISEPFIRKPVATTLLTVAVALAGAAGLGVARVAGEPERAGAEVFGVITRRVSEGFDEVRLFARKRAAAE